MLGTGKVCRKEGKGTEPQSGGAADELWGKRKAIRLAKHPSHSQGKKGTLPDMRRAPPKQPSNCRAHGQGQGYRRQGGRGGRILSGYSGICRRIPGGSSPCVVDRTGSLSVAVLESGNGQSGGSGARGSVHSARRSGVTPTGRDSLAGTDCCTARPNCSPSVSRETWNQPRPNIPAWLSAETKRKKKKIAESFLCMACTANYRS